MVFVRTVEDDVALHESTGLYVMVTALTPSGPDIVTTATSDLELVVVDELG